jgi:hypothetical protein
MWGFVWGCRALGNVGVNADNVVKIGEAGGIEAIVEAMRGRGCGGTRRMQGCRCGDVGLCRTCM